MAFEFAVSSVGRIPSANVIYVDGHLNRGKIVDGANAIIRGRPDRQGSIKSVALVNSSELGLNELPIWKDPC